MELEVTENKKKNVQILEYVEKDLSVHVYVYVQGMKV